MTNQDNRTSKGRLLTSLLVATLGAIVIWCLFVRLSSRADQSSQTLDAEAGSAYCLAFSPDGKQLAAGYGRTIRGANIGTVVVWDLSTGKQVTAILDKDLPPVRAVAFTPDGTKLAIAT